jgi:hypothetical protein
MNIDEFLALIYAQLDQKNSDHTHLLFNHSFKHLHEVEKIRGRIWGIAACKALIQETYNSKVKPPVAKEITPSTGEITDVKREALYGE